jgi:hypothetical protein
MCLQSNENARIRRNNASMLRWAIWVLALLSKRLGRHNAAQTTAGSSYLNVIRTKAGLPAATSREHSENQDR